MDLAVDVGSHGGTPVLAVQGELDIHGVPQVQERLLGLLGDGHPRVVIDFSHLTFIDSSGLGVVLSAVRRLRDRGGELVIAGAPPRIIRLFEITGVAEMMVLRESVEDSIDAGETGGSYPGRD